MDLKRQAGERAAEFIEDGMTVGLGTGSTVYWTILKLALMVKDGLKIRAVPTSLQTAKLSIEQNIPIGSLDEVRELDLTIDGSDEISPNLDLIKGGGGALLREKLVAAASKRLIIVADQSKLVAVLGSFPLPIEIVSFGWETTARRVANLDLKPALRMNEGKPFRTDNGNFILDCTKRKIKNPAQLHRELKLLTGVVETGLFVEMANTVVVAGEGGIRIINRNSENL